MAAADDVSSQTQSGQDEQRVGARFRNDGDLQTAFAEVGGLSAAQIVGAGGAQIEEAVRIDGGRAADDGVSALSGRTRQSDKIVNAEVYETHARAGDQQPFGQAENELGAGVEGEVVSNGARSAEGGGGIFVPACARLASTAASSTL